MRRHQNGSQLELDTYPTLEEEENATWAYIKWSSNIILPFPFIFLAKEMNLANMLLTSSIGGQGMCLFLISVASIISLAACSVFSCSILYSFANPIKSSERCKEP